MCINQVQKNTELEDMGIEASEAIAETSMHSFWNAEPFLITPEKVYNADDGRKRTRTLYKDL